MEKARIGQLKLHLRNEPDGTGVLVINSQAVLFLDKVALAYFQSFFKEFSRKLSRAQKMKLPSPDREPKEPSGEMSDRSLDDPQMVGQIFKESVVKSVRRKFRVDTRTAASDWERLWGSVLACAQGGLCPFSEFEVKRIDPMSMELSAPYRCDLILTYRCQNNCPHCYAGGPHETVELDTDQWKRIIGRLADWGVPTLVFTGGEPLLRPDLDALIQCAQDKGCVTGLITNGRLLTKERVESLNRSGLDFVQITLESNDESIHNQMVGFGKSQTSPWRETVEGIGNAARSIYVTTNTTITKDNKDTIVDTVRFLKTLGVQKFGTNALIRSGRGVSQEGIESLELKSILERVIDESSQLNFPFIWYTPTCYHDINPCALGLGVKTCSAASTVLAVEPDGNVMPCQSYYKSLGNALKDDFPVMWRHPLALALRRRRTANAPQHPEFPSLPEECRTCPELSLCGGSCPLERNTLKAACR